MVQIEQNDLFKKELNRLNMDISEIAYARLDTSWNISVQSPFTRIYGIVSGEGHVVSKGKDTPLLPGNIVIIPAETSVSLFCPEKMEKLYFHINLLRYDGYDWLGEYNNPIVLSDHSQEIDNAIRLFREHSITGAMALRSWLWKIIVEAISQENVPLRDIEEYSHNIKKAIRYIDEHLNADLSAALIADDLFLSAGHLQKQFRAEVGVPLGRYIRDRLMFAAERQLRTTTETVRTVSEQLGYCDQFYFTRCFTARYGMSPTAYRRNRLLMNTATVKKK